MCDGHWSEVRDITKWIVSSVLWLNRRFFSILWKIVEENNAEIAHTSCMWMIRNVAVAGALSKIHGKGMVNFSVCVGLRRIQEQ